ncbi:MAG: branched-chain amino acid ABC transporter permease [Sphaerobacter sp.]|nr:branched-chain amino acid ABC transporter permease [Sphaerobacter sp.]
MHSVALHWEALTRGSRTVFGIPQYTHLWMAAGWMLLFVVLAFLFRQTSLGLRLRAARDDEAAAWSVGVSSAWVRWVAWVLSVFVAAVAGGLWAHFITTFSPNSFYLRQTFLIVAMLIIGGSGSVSGAVIGAVAVSLTSEALRSVESWLNVQRATQTALGELIPFQLVGFTEIVIALAMIAVLILRPAGLTRGREIRWPFGPKLGRGTPVEAASRRVSKTG